MCSIFGYISERHIDVRVFQQCLKHRGPDGDGIYLERESSLTLGHSRLAIIDLSHSADQPMAEDDGKFVLVFNGEIYNYLEIRERLVARGYHFKTHSDTEVILKGYSCFGKSLLPMLRGMFAFVLFDKHLQKLFMARDRFGIKPLYYARGAAEFAFASEVTPLVKSGIATRTISRFSLDHYFTFGSVKQPDTIFDSVKSLPPASWMEVDVRTLQTTSAVYYNFVDSALALGLADLSYEEAVGLIRMKLEDATRYHLVADVEVGAFLSGGVDSTAVVALMSKLARKPIKTFSVGFRSETEVFDESSLARETAARLGCDHTDVLVDEGEIGSFFEGFVRALDQPSIDGLNTYIVSSAAAKKVKVVLSGLGGDEVFAGYDHFGIIQSTSLQRAGMLDRLLQAVNKFRPNRFTSRFAFIGRPPAESVRDVRQILTMRKIKGLLLSPVHQWTVADDSRLSVLQRVSSYEVNNYLVDTLLRDSDVMSMAHGLECRPVLLDHALMEAAFALPDSFKIRGITKKSVFIDAVRDLIPEHVYNRKKTGFEMPFASWMRGPLKGVMKEAFSSDLAKKLYTRRYISSALASLENGNTIRDYWSDLVLIRWMQITGATL